MTSLELAAPRRVFDQNKSLLMVKQNLGTVLGLPRPDYPRPHMAKGLLGIPSLIESV